MTATLSLIPLAAPLSLLIVAAVAVREPGRTPRRVLALTRFTGVFGILVAGLTAALVAVEGPATGPKLGGEFAALGLRLDALSAAMFALVAFLGAIVMHYSRSYLEGDARHGAFLGRLATTVAAVMLLVLSGTLLQLALMWTLTSLALHRLLLFYPDRPGAVIAGRKKFLLARLGDGALAGAAMLLTRAFGTGDIAEISERATEAAASGTIPAGATLAVALLATAAALKSAQFPTHGWLAEVMETPTPVSALLHAGILNGGAFLIVRLAPVLLLSPGTMHAMILIGGFTALLMSVVMVAQSSIKTQLAYSSAAHMGFMLLLCGLGAFPVAILHLIAHSLYKAHAFLSSGSAVEVHRASHVPGYGPSPRVLAVVGAFVLAIGTVAAVGAVVDVSVLERPVSVGLAAMLAVSLVQLLGQATTTRAPLAVLARTISAAIATALAFFLLEKGAVHVLDGAVPVVTPHGAATLALMALVTAAFAFAATAQLLLPALARSTRWAPLYVHLRNGLYTNAAFDRLVGALRPVAPASLASETR
ncbi:MAG: proton-conducting transporter membrane subunit [Planctomycetota bacterium]|nr:proton-conducting transporter membrane subunit [Planctomycetota bacterium]